MKISSLQKGLVGHWPMSQDSLKGSLLGDKTPYSNDGTIYGATFTTDRKGQANKAMSFDGNDYIDCGNGSNLNIARGISVSIWVKTFSLSTKGHIVSRYGRTGQQYSLYQSNTGLTLYINGGASANALTAPNIFS